MTDTDASSVQCAVRQVRDPSFDMVTFLRRLRADVPVIVRAYLLGQVDVLAEHCAPQMVEQLSAIIRAQHAQVTHPSQRKMLI